MNMKKIISAFCALSMAATSFVSMAITANAEGETVLWSDTFNGYENVVDHHNQSGTLGKVLADGTSSIAVYEGIEGITLTTASRAQGDDSAWFKIADKEGTDKCLQSMVCRFASADRGNNIAFNETYSATADTDIVLAFKVKYHNDGGTTYNSGFKTNTTFIDMEAAGIEQDVWTDIKVVVKSTGTSVYFNGSTDAAVTGSDTTVTNIKLDGYENGAYRYDEMKSTSHPVGYPTFWFDDIVVYSCADGLSSTVPAAETHGNIAVTYANAPSGKVPEGMYEYVNYKFDDQTANRLTFMNDGNADGYTAFDGLLLTVGQDGGDTRSETKWDIVGNSKSDPEYGKDMYLRASNGTGSTANRGPKLTIDKEVAERETVGISFATRLHAGEAAPAEVIFSGDLVASSSKGNLASPLAMITTDDEAASGVYACDNPLTKVADGGTNVLEVADNEWVLVTIKATRPKDKTVTASIAVTQNVGTDDEATTYILGSETEMVTIQDSTKSGVNNLPYITFRSGNDTDYGASGSSNDIDNIIVYSDAEPAETPDSEVTDMTISADGLTVTAPTTASETAVVIKVSADGKVELVKTAITVGDNTIAWTTAPVAGDKIMVFNGFKSLMPAALVPVVIAEVTE